MTDVLETLKLYLRDYATVMSRRAVEDVIDEIERLRSERKRSDDLYAILDKAVEYLVQMELEGETTSAVPLRMALAIARETYKRETPPQ